jgi:YVTN family beta-propeller protein
VGSGPFGVKVNSNGILVVVSNADSNTLSIIDTTLNQVIGTVPVGTLPLYLAILDLGV